VASNSVVLCNLWIVSGYFRSFRDARPSGTGMEKLNCCRQTTTAVRVGARIVGQPEVGPKRLAGNSIGMFAVNQKRISDRKWRERRDSNLRPPA
jgi:hypothetical protein